MQTTAGKQKGVHVAKNVSADLLGFGLLLLLIFSQYATGSQSR
jgi:hypothetical protein